MADQPAEIPVAGVTALEHTADVGIEVRASTVEELFLRAAQGMAHLLLEHARPAPQETRWLTVTAPDRAALLRKWLRELLFWHETDGFTLWDAAFQELSEERLRASVRGGPDPCSPVREIKGVTLHRLTAERREGQWYARVIFDV